MNNFHSKLDLVSLNVSRANNAELAKIYRKRANHWFKQANRRAKRNKKDETFLLMEEAGFMLTELKTNEHRMQSRAKNLAYAYLRGVPYVCVEQKTNVKSFSGWTPKGFWNEVSEQAAIWGKRLHVEDQKNLHMYQKEVTKWRNEHPGAVALKSLNSKYEKEPDGAPFQTMQMFLKTYGDVWLWL